MTNKLKKISTCPQPHKCRHHHKHNCWRPASILAENCRRRAFVGPPAMATLPRMQGPLEAPFSIGWCVWCGSREASGALSRWRKVFVYLW